VENTIIEKKKSEFLSDINKTLTEVKSPLPYIIIKEYEVDEINEAGEATGNKIDMVKYADLTDKGEDICPYSYSCALKELLSSDSGRTEDTTYNKMKIGEYVEISISYRGMNSECLSKVLNYFSDEYIKVCYFDPKDNMYKVNEFYMGETSIPMYNGAMGFWDGFSLTLSQRKADTSLFGGND